MRFLKGYSDEECIDLFLSSHDKDAFGEIFSRYFEDTYRFVYSRVGKKQWTEDIVSDTFYTLIDVLKLFNKNSQVKTFIFGIAVNKVKQFWQKKYKSLEVKLNEDFILTEEMPEDDYEYDQLSKMIPKVLGKLPENYRLVLTERFLNEKSIKETAAILGLSEANIRVIQFRALKKAVQIGERLLDEK